MNSERVMLPAIMLIAIAAFLVTEQRHILSAAALLALVGLTWQERGSWTPRGGLGLANALTWARVLATAGLLSRGGADLWQAALAFSIFSLDGVDGMVARARGESSTYGASLDKECDAFFVLVLSVLLWRAGVAGYWVLVAGFWRYAYGFGVAFARQLATAPRSNWARYTYSSSSCAMMLALIPDNPAARPLCVFAACAISASFLRSIYYSRPRS